MPAVVPADVQISPSRTKMRSGSSVTCGYRRRQWSVLFQCVVARRPSSRPASARRKVPEQTLVMRRAFARLSHATIFSAAATERTISPPDTMSIRLDRNRQQTQMFSLFTIGRGSVS